MFSNSDSHLSEFQDGGVPVLGQVALALLGGCRGGSGLQASLPAVPRLLLSVSQFSQLKMRSWSPGPLRYLRLSAPGCPSVVFMT